MKRKIISLFTLFLTVLFSAAAFFGCNKETVRLDGDYVVITAADAEGGTTLLAYMQKLQEDGKLTFKVEDGMVTEIDGKKNAADFSSCWMLYTSDTNASNEAWGTVEYEEKVYGSAVLGAESLVIVKGETYIWWYQTF
ncbi:MAG: hypothetical protein IJX91_05255 [Clostridia bacterium]|nr:hypothetical protein [Clostridia bacterium]